MNNRHSSFRADCTSKRSIRGPWPWLLGVGPALVVVASLATGWIALTRGDPVVADDYYKIGLSINRRLAAIPASLPVPGATLTIGAAGEVRVRLSDSTPLPAELRLTVRRPGQADASRPLMLAREGGDEFVGVLRDVPDGRRIVTLASDAWILPVTTVDHWPATITLRGAPSPS